MKRLILALGLLAVFAAPTVSRAQVIPTPSLMNYQGRLTNPSGNPAPDGTYLVRFSLWTAASGGTEKWSQTFNPVNVKNGTFAVVFNMANQFDLFDGNLYLEIKIGSDAPLTPRQQLVSVAYAMKANSVPDGSITNSKILSVDWSKITGTPFLTLNLPFVGSTNSPNPAFKVTNQTGYGIWGEATGAGGTGVHGSTTHPAGVGGFFYSSAGNALVGTAAGDQGTGVIGNANNLVHSGGFFTNAKGNGVFGRSEAGGYGVYGTSQTGYGGAFISTTGQVSLYAENAVLHGTAIKGVATGRSENYVYPIGVHGKSEIGYGVHGESKSGVGVWGRSEYTGVSGHGIGASGTGIFGFGSGYAGFFSGDVYVSGNFTQSSDVRYKSNIATLPNALDTILNLRGVTYEWKRDEFKDKNFKAGKQIGFIAQEVEKILPELVRTDANGYKSVAYVNVVPVLVEALKTQQQQIQALRTQTTQQQAQYHALLQRLERLEAERK